MGRAIWNGSISFGLVQIPVGLHSAEQTDELHFTLLDRRDKSPIHYRRVSGKGDDNVEWKDIVKGYELKKGQYVIVTDDDFKKANVEATQTIDILCFVDRAEIDPRYYDKPYYLEPKKNGRKAYAVLRETLRDSKQVGIAKIVVRTRQHIAALWVEDRTLVLQLLRFEHELRSPADLDVPEKDLRKAGVSARELTMAQQLLAGMTESWKPSQYHDEFRDDLLTRIKKKAKAGEDAVIDEPVAKPRRRSNVIDLMDLLKKSVEEGRPRRKSKIANVDASKKRTATRSASWRRQTSASEARGRGTKVSAGGKRRASRSKEPTRKSA